MSLASNGTTSGRFKMFMFLTMAIILSACNSGGGGGDDAEAEKITGASDCVIGNSNIGDCVLG